MACGTPTSVFKIRVLAVFRWSDTARQLEVMVRGRHSEASVRLVTFSRDTDWQGRGNRPQEDLPASARPPAGSCGGQHRR